MPINNIIKLRRGNATDWSAINGGDGPTLNAGEPGFEIDSNILKIGDGSTSWKDLKPVGADQSLYKVKNTSGGIIRKGQVVRANGTVGNNDAIQVTLFIADGNVPEYTIMGLATQDMNNNDFGYVTAFGIVKGIDTDPDNLSTNICAAGENWLDGDILYASPTASGKLTKNKPQHDTILAIVLNSADNGSLFARPTWNPHLDDVHDVNTSGVTNNQYLRYDSSSDTWLPTSSGIFNNVYASGNVGIGTATPSYKLEVTNNADSSHVISASNTNSGTNSSCNFRAASDAVLSFFISHAVARTTNRYGFAQGGWTEILSQYGNGIVIGTDTYDRPIVFGNNSTERMRIAAGGNVGIGTTTPSYKLQVNGSFGATTKSFRIDHPSRPNFTLEYGSLESPYHGVRLTGRGKVVKGSGTVLLPSYLKDLIHDDETINIQITNIKHGKTIYVDEIDLNNDRFTVKADKCKTLGDLEFFWTFTGTRKDVDRLVVEAEK